MTYLSEAGSQQKPHWFEQNRHLKLWYRIEDPEINPHSYGHIIFDEGGKNAAYSTNCADKIGYPPSEE